MDKRSLVWRSLLGFGLAGMAIGAGVTYPRWLPRVTGWIDGVVASQRHPTAGDAHVDTHVGHDDHAHAAHAISSASLELSPQARLNLGLTTEALQAVTLTTYQRTISVPASIVARPGRSRIVVSSPLSGVITHVHAVTGESVTPGQLLFEVRLTYEELVDIQTEYLKSISELEVENREILRLEQVTQSGAVSGKSLLERRYAKDKLEAIIRSQREALRLHGLSDRQIDDIGTNGKLLGALQIVAPDIDTHSEKEELRLSRNPYRPISYPSQTVGQSSATPFAPPAIDSKIHSEQHAHHDAEPELHTSEGRQLVIDELQVHKGQAVVAGEKLCVLSDFTKLFIEGRAFEQDINAIAMVESRGWRVRATFPDGDRKTTVDGLKVAFVGNSIDANSRTLSVYVELPNKILSDATNSEGQRFINWQYRMGQRLELEIPVEQWDNQIVLPPEAVVRDGADWYVFLYKGSRFDRLPVHVKYRDQSAVIIAGDGALRPGNVIAMRSAHQMQMALKNKSGAAVDPHAGHNH